MVEETPRKILATICNNIAEIKNIVNSTQRLEDSVNNQNYEDIKKLKVVIDETKSILDSLNEKIINLNKYFNKNYETLKNISQINNELVTANTEKENVQDSTINDINHENEKINEKNTDLLNNENAKPTIKCVDITKLLMSPHLPENDPISLSDSDNELISTSVTVNKESIQSNLSKHPKKTARETNSNKTKKSVLKDCQNGISSNEDDNHKDLGELKKEKKLFCSVVSLPKVPCEKLYEYYNEEKNGTSERFSPSTTQKQQNNENIENHSCSDSDVNVGVRRNTRKKFIKTKSKRKNNIIDSDSDDSSRCNKKLSNCSSNSESEKESNINEEPASSNSTENKRKRIKRLSDSSDEDLTTRKTIRKMIAHDSLTETTKKAEKEEKERKTRIAERQKKYNVIFDEDKPIDATIDKLVLDFDESTGNEILSVDKILVDKLKPHQATGIKFMWDACFESVERINNTNGSGCILAHCMGLGKTLQVIALIHTLMNHENLTGIKRVMVVAPLNTVLNWVAEFNKWLEDVEQLEIFELVTSKQNNGRQYAIEDWIKKGGVLIIGYDMFRNLTNSNNKRLRKSMHKTFQHGLVDPGPDLIICDEGHLLKNEKSNISIAMNKIKTSRRIILTGTPMQNNLKEYYCMVQFVKPNLLGTYKEYINRFVNPITNGQYTDSTVHDISIMKKRSHVLHTMLDGVVQRRDYSVLTPYLPPKYEYVLFLMLSKPQIEMYQHYLMDFAKNAKEITKGKTFLFTDFQEFQRICTHPRVLLNKNIERQKKAMFNDDSDSEGSLKDFVVDDSEENSSSSSNEDESSDDNSKSSKELNKLPQTRRLTRNAANINGIDIDKRIEESERELNLSDNWWGKYISSEQLDDISISSKLYLLFEILQQCELIGDKLLVFSQSLYSLDIIEYFLAKIDEATQNNETDKFCNFKGSWSLGLDYFRLDGSSSCDNRSAWCSYFNDPENLRARLFIISTRAGGIGINLTGANRVIVFDVSWNPSHDIQSIYRVYRFGQHKPSYIYRFVTNGTMEMKVYERQVTKQAISKRVIDEQQIDRHYNQNDLAVLYNFDPKPENQPTPLVPKDVLLAELLQTEKDKIYKYHEHQSLLENKKDEELNEAERKAAWEEYENEKSARVTMSSGGYIGNIPVYTISKGIANMLQRDNPSWDILKISSVVPVVLQELQLQVERGESLLFKRILDEIKLMQIEMHKKRLREMYMQRQQFQLMQNQYPQAINPSTGSGMMPFQNIETFDLND